MSPKLLVADDSVTIRRVIELTFADEGVEVIAVSNGRQAIERIERERPDVVLADVSMPERTGYEVAWFVKNNPHLAHVPVILLSGAFEPVDDARAQEAGCRGVLAKPLEPQVVIRRVRALLDAAGVATAHESVSASEAAPESSVAAIGDSSGHENGNGGTTPQFLDPDDTESLDEYFERLDSHYGKAHPALEMPDPIPSQAHGSATPEQTGPRSPAVSSPRSEASRPASTTLSLAEAFQSLLAAEEGLGDALAQAADHAGEFDRADSHDVGSDPESPAVASTSSSALDDVVERASRRLIEELASTDTRRMIDNIVRQVAERVVREELQRRSDERHPEL
jgi:CheY-like chemotaxis protein